MRLPYLFVYGTLRRGRRRPLPRILGKDTHFVGYATFQGKLYNIGTYPGAVPSANKSDHVLGELYCLSRPTKVLARLDHYEECSSHFTAPTEYIRRIQLVQMTTGKVIAAWVYLYNHPVDKQQRLPSGDYNRAFKGTHRHAHS